MAVRIRLSRGGSKKRPFYRIVAADQRAPRDGRFIERLGSYNPMLPKDHADRLVVDAEKVKSWISKGASVLIAIVTASKLPLLASAGLFPLAIVAFTVAKSGLLFQKSAVKSVFWP